MNEFWHGTTGQQRTAFAHLMAMRGQPGHDS
jgi:hypothetical protein